VFIHIKFILWELLIQVLLECFESYSVAILMLSIVISILLQTVISQVHIVVLVRQRVVITWSPDITLFINVKVIFACENWPDPYIKFPAFEEKGSFDIFLDYPELIGRWSRCNKLLNIPNIPEYFNSFSLIHSCRFD
jgi:hypothetical protein